MAASPGQQSLELMAQNERAIAALYERYATLFPAWATFWHDLAEDERQHAAVIDSIKSRAQDSRPGRFKPEAIRTFTGYVRSYLDAADTTVSPATALATSRGIESGLIESRFFEHFSQDDSKVAAALSSLKSETDQHLRKIEDALSRARTHKGHEQG